MFLCLFLNNFRYTKAKHIKTISNAMNADVEDDDAKDNEIVRTKRPDKPKLQVLKQIDVEERVQPDESPDKMKLIKENLFLLSEIDKLKHSNRSLSQRIYYLESIVRAPLKK